MIQAKKNVLQSINKTIDSHHVNAEANLLLHGLVADVELLRVEPLPLTEVLLSRHVSTH